MTPKQFKVLQICVLKCDVTPHMDGLSPNFAVQMGYVRQVQWLLKYKMIRKLRGRFVATRCGRRVYEYQVTG